MLILHIDFILVDVCGEGGALFESGIPPKTGEKQNVYGTGRNSII